jgi:hypothetical protein
MNPRRSRYLLLLPGLLGILLAAFTLWASLIPEPMTEALEAMRSDSQVLVQSEPWLAFLPTSADPKAGLILYPGGRVDPRAYAPLAHAVADEDYLAVIVPMPLNLAIFSPEQAAVVIEAYPDIKAWVVGGHSLGGAMAAQFAGQHPSQVAGLLLLASYPASNNDLSSFGLHVTSIYATSDGLATPEKIKASETLLPANTVWIAIEGGNHSQFGWYGFQKGDNPANLSRQEQQSIMLSATIDLLRSAEEDIP